MFHFLHPLWLLAVPPFWVLAAWLGRRAGGDGAWSGVIDAALLPALRLQAGKGTRSPWWLLALAWTLAALALAGMTWQRAPSAAYRAPIDWILVLDLSPSMAAADVPPDRAARARYAIADFLNAAKDERVALVVFAGEAHTVAPLTTDVATIRALLPPLVPSIMPESGDQLGPALNEASRLMRTVASRRAQVVVFTDGVSDPANALRAAQRLRQQGALVNVIGVGTTSGAPLPDAQGGFVQDAQGRSVLSRLAVDQLEHIAAAGGGYYTPVSEAGALVARLQALSASPASGQQINTHQHVNAWQNGGIWLLPPLLLVVPLLARRGWL